MLIKRDLVIKILKYLDKNKDFYFPFLIIHKEVLNKKDKFMELKPNDWVKVQEDDKKYQMFELWENLQDIDTATTKLMAQGFLEKITNEKVIDKIIILQEKYEKRWNKNIWYSDDIEIFGQNEYFGGKLEGIEQCLEILQNR